MRGPIDGHFKQTHHLIYSVKEYDITEIALGVFRCRYPLLTTEKGGTPSGIREHRPVAGSTEWIESSEARGKWSSLLSLPPLFLCRVDPGNRTLNPSQYRA